jgi:hypothetical protein
MKKLILVVLALMVLVIPAYAVQTQTEIASDEVFTGTSDFIETDLYIADSQRVTFFTTWDRTATTACATATVTAAMSIDGENWEDISWFDVAGGTTPVTSEILGSDGTYAGYIDPIIIAPYIRIGVWFAGDETTSTGTMTVTVVQDK